MGQVNSQAFQLSQEETEDARQLKTRVETEGSKAIAEHIKENLDRWKKEELKVGICGRTRTGKSTFINAVLGLRPNQPGAAKSGSGNTTWLVTPYTHPRNENIVLVDFPGVGTPEHPKSTYMTKVFASKCDYFFIFFDSVIHEDDVWLADCLKEKKKPFCFVRSMIDVDIKNAKFDGKNADNVLTEVRENVQKTVKSNSVTRGSNIFFISGRYTDKGEFSELLTHMEESLPSLKFDSIMFSISVISKDVIERKYEKLQNRIKIVSVGAAAISLEPIPILDLVLNLKLIIRELKHYIVTFGLSKDKLEGLPADVIARLNVMNILSKSDIDLSTFIVQQIGKASALVVVESVADFFFPIIGSLISSPTTYLVVKTFLNNYLTLLKEDTIIVYDSVLYSQQQLHTGSQVNI